jgi:signal transduction histidine kinase/CheY-like chemotaxis protein
MATRAEPQGLSGMTLRRLLFALGAVLVGINVLSAIWDIRTERALVERNALRDYGNLTRLLANQTSIAIESADLLLRAAANDISTYGVGDPAARIARLRDRVSGLPHMRAVLMLDRNGRVVLSTDERSDMGADFSNRPYFIPQRDGTAQGRYVSEPFRGTVTGRWAFAVSEPLRDKAGRFAGVVAAVVNVEYFDRLYRSRDIGADGFVALLTRDGLLVTRVPSVPDLFGKRLSASHANEASADIIRDGTFSGWSHSAVDPQVKVLMSVAPIPDSSLVVAVGSPERTALEPWRTEAGRVIVRTLLTSAVMLALLWLAARELTRRAQADLHVQESRRLAQAEQERLQNRLRQAEKMEAVGRLAGGIAHDFNNILGGILGYGEMLLESTAEGSEEQRYARNLLIAANRARDLVEQILAYSRTQKVARTSVDIGRIVRETLEVIRGSLPEGIALDLALPEAPLAVIGDPTQLHQVVMNLCTNAIHAMGGEGRLAVSLQAVDLEQEATFAHDTLAPGPYVKLVVSDTGTGMDQATLARIFEPFFTTKEVGRGTGLGLSLVYGIVADSAGAVHAASEVGRGSTFEIYLPRTHAGSPVAETAEGPLERGHGECVLLVDDEKPLLIMTAELLARLGYEPAPFSDARAALASLEAMPQAYDVVLTDETMPGLTGTAFAAAVRKAQPALPVILISGHTGPHLSEMALGAGVREVLRKPIQSRELAAALARVLAA